jgi:hypothetical protein
MPRKRRSTPAGTATATVHSVERMILLVRGRKVMVDTDLAALYGVETGALNQAVKRNRARFPKDFMFTLTRREGQRLRSLRSQFVILKRGAHLKYAPYAFTEQGVAMLASVLKSERAIAVNIAIMRAFVHLRQILTAHRNLARRLSELERTYDGKFAVVFDAIRQLMAEPPYERRPRIGFIVDAASSGGRVRGIRG